MSAADDPGPTDCIVCGLKGWYLCVHPPGLMALRRRYGRPRPKTWREKAFDLLWVNAPELKSRATRQARLLRTYFGGLPYPPPTNPTWYWGVGHHAGRLMALRLEAYDRKETR